MAASDGQVLGLTKIMDNGPDNQRFNIVIVAEGFQGATAAAQTDFNNRCQLIVNQFQAEPWFSEGLLASINIHRLNVRSTDTGADNPATCPDMSTATAFTAATFFDASYCTSGARRCLGLDWGLVRSTLNAQLPQWHAAAVLVNSTQRGGCASGNVFATALSTDWLDVVMHELGHAAFGLADEYSTYQGCGSSETDRNNAPAGEPMEPNITANGNLAGLKWGHLIGPLTPVPTMQNPDCTTCDLRPNVRADELEIGLFEGAGYYHCGYYRPAYTCRMRDSGKPYCRVCAEAVINRLRPFFSTAPALAASVSALDFGNVGTGSTLSLPFEISNVGSVAVTGITLASSSPNFSVSPATIANLAPGVSQTITVLFGPVFTNGVRSGTILLTSNAPTLSIDLLAVGCTPAARMQIQTADGPLTLNFGDVGRRLTMYRWFEVNNLRTTCSSQLRVTLSSPPPGFDYAPGTNLTFTLPAPTATQPFTSRRVYVAFSSPAIGGPDFNGMLTVTTPDDPITTSASLSLSTRAIDPPAVDSVLVIDRSGSMSEPTGVPGASKMDLAIQAANLYIALLKDNDRIGVVRFNQVANNPGDILQPLVLAGDPATGAGRASARGVLSLANLTPSGNTSIGGGTILGSNVLDSASATARAIVVLTDGIQNTSPDIPAASTAVAAKMPRQRVFAVGLGLNQLEDKLIQLASVTNGVAQITGELAGDREFLLQKLYVQILSDVADEAFVQDPTNVLTPGSEQATDVYIGEVDVAADFILVYRRASSYPGIEVWLESPDGTIIRPGDAGSTFPNILFVSGNGHAYFRCQFPAFPGRPKAHIGRWRVWLASRKGRSVLTHGTTAETSVNFYYSVMAKARSDLRLGGFLAQSSYTPGSPMVVTLEPTLYGQPVKLDAPIEARVTRPDGTTRIISLTETVYGQYQGVFEDTYQLGVYPASAVVMATTPAGAMVTRYRFFTGLIYHPGKKDDNNGGGDKDPDCRHARQVQKQLEKLLDRLAEKHPEEREEIARLVKWLREFVTTCCKRGQPEKAERLQTMLDRVKQLLNEDGTET
ncbi:M64 family metallopeptidase [Spirosoma luteum]|uniref:M64 family metallopeptidase n=1 Tax=Spirosoma luteum TaxID=431553 RepID=UPI000364AC05|nr:M64 family metallopeptidase [Spirosoma luteum]